MVPASVISDVWIVVPAYNESAALPEIVASLSQHGYQVVVVDDGSETELLPALYESQAHVLRHAVNLGQGAALQTGITYALASGAAYIVTFDADGQHLHTEIDAMLRPLLERTACVTLGSRFIEGGNAVNITKAKKRTLALATLFTRLSVGIAVTDTHNGFRAFTADAAAKLNITQNRMAHASQILSIIKAKGLPYQEVPVTVVYSEYSMRKGQRLSNIINILWEFVRGVLYR